MYNRYIPQSDGSYRRRTVQDTSGRRDTARKEPVSQTQPEHSDPPRNCCDPVQENFCPVQRSASVGSFLKNLLPKEFDTGDLMIVLLLLLMSGDCQEDQNWALLTLVLYLFL